MSVAVSKDPSAPAALTLVSASGKRMHPRVALPMTVEFADGERREVRDWSIAGFSLPDGGLPSKEGAIHHVRLHVALQDCEIVIDADAKVSWAVDGQARGFRFIGLSADKSRIFDHFIQTGLEGDAAVVGGLPVAARGMDAMRKPGRLRKATRTSYQLLRFVVIASVVVGGAALVGSRFLTVTTDYAAVSADLQQVHAPEAGFLRSDVLLVGAHVKAGQTIGMIQPVATPQARLSTETEIAALQSTLDQQNIALEQAKAGFETFLRAARTDLTEAQAARTLLDQQVAAEDNIFQRVLAMKQKGIVADERVDQERQVLLNLQRTLSAARDTEEAMRQKAANAEAGRFTSDGRSTQKSPADLQQEVRGTEATLGRLKAMLVALDQPLPIVSPCECDVSSIAATPGAYVAAGAHLADLSRDTGGAVSVDALVQNARLSYVKEGQSVSVYLANSPDALTGRVTRVNFDPANTGRIGLPLSLRTLDDYGLMTVVVDGAKPGLPSGLPATIMAPIEWRTLVANTPATAWVGSLVSATAPLKGWLGGVVDRVSSAWPRHAGGR